MPGKDIQKFEKNVHVKATRHTIQTETDVDTESNTDTLPDWLTTPWDYEPVIPTTEEHTAAELRENKEPVNEEPVNEEPRRLTPVYTYSSIN